MTVSIITGPSITSGNTNPVQNTEPDQGPSLTFQGSGLIDPRYVANIGAAPGTKIFGMYSNSYVVSTDCTPVVLSNTRLSAAVAPTAGVPIPLVAVQGAGASPAMPVLPFGLPAAAANVVSTGVAIDFGFTVANSVSGTKVLTIPAGAWRYFSLNQRIIVAGAGSGGGNLFTTVTLAVVPGVLTITTADNAQTTTLGCQVGSNHPVLNCAWPYLNAGVISLFDPTQGVTRAVSITASAGTTNAVTVRGYDIYGQAMSEVINAVGAATTPGRKAFKTVVSVTPAATVANTLSVGTTDVYGINFRADYWEYMNIFVAGAFVPTNVGWTVSDVTPTATNATGDVRGTYLLQAGSSSNGDGTVANWATSRRLAMFSSLPIFNTVNATNLNYVSMYGSTQA